MSTTATQLPTHVPAWPPEGGRGPVLVPSTDAGVRHAVQPADAAGGVPLELLRWREPVGQRAVVLPDGTSAVVPAGLAVLEVVLAEAPWFARTGRLWLLVDPHGESLGLASERGPVPTFAELLGAAVPVGTEPWPFDSAWPLPSGPAVCPDPVR